MSDVVNTLPALGALGTAATVAFKSPELLKELYGDIAKPGVSQVGKAIGTILGLGNTILIPLRLLSETGRAFEQKSFEEIADRFKHIPDADIVTPPPEIALPILENLSQTIDPTLRAMFIELLAKASTAQGVDLVHPSFSQVISSITPQEAIVINDFKGHTYKPLVSINLVKANGSGRNTIHDLIMNPPIGIKDAHNLPLYISNLMGLGVIEVIRESRLTSAGVYDDTIAHARTLHTFDEAIEIAGELRKVEYNKFVCRISPYGERLLMACSN